MFQKKKIVIKQWLYDDLLSFFRYSFFFRINRNTPAPAASTNTMRKAGHQRAKKPFSRVSVFAGSDGSSPSRLGSSKSELSRSELSKLESSVSPELLSSSSGPGSSEPESSEEASSLSSKEDSLSEGDSVAGALFGSEAGWLSGLELSDPEPSGWEDGTEEGDEDGVELGVLLSGAKDEVEDGSDDGVVEGLVGTCASGTSG